MGGRYYVIVGYNVLLPPFFFVFSELHCAVNTFVPNQIILIIIITRIVPDPKKIILKKSKAQYGPEKTKKNSGSRTLDLWKHRYFYSVSTVRCPLGRGMRSAWQS